MAMTSNSGNRPTETVDGSELEVRIMGLLNDVDDKTLAQIAEIVLGKEVMVKGEDTFTIRDYLTVTVTIPN